MLRLLDLAAFNVFDFDAYGSPWEQAYILSARRSLSPGERFGLVLTDGSGLRMKFGSAPTALGLLANVPLKAAGLTRLHDKIIDSALDAVVFRLGGAVVERWQASGKTGARMAYIGTVIEGHKKSPGH